MYETGNANAKVSPNRLGGQDEPAVENLAQSIAREIQNINERAAGLRSRITEFRDRAVGAEPEAKQGGSTPRPVPCGVIGAQRQYLQDTAQYIEDCHALMSRLETII